MPTKASDLQSVMHPKNSFQHVPPMADSCLSLPHRARLRSSSDDPPTRSMWKWGALDPLTTLVSCGSTAQDTASPLGPWVRSCMGFLRPQGGSEGKGKPNAVVTEASAEATSHSGLGPAREHWTVRPGGKLLVSGIAEARGHSLLVLQLPRKRVPRTPRMFLGLEVGCGKAELHHRVCCTWGWQTDHRTMPTKFEFQIINT